MSTTVKLEPELFKTISEMAKSRGISENEIVNDIVKNNIESKEDIFNKIKDISNGKAIIGNKNRYNPKKENWEKLINMKKSTNKINPVQSLLDLRNGKG